MKTALLSSVSKATALSYISRIESRGYYRNNYPDRIPNSPYIDKMLSQNALICFKCLEEIKLRTEYTYKSKIGRVTKYYHSSCYDSMFY